MRLPINDTDGIPVVVEVSMCNYPKVNLERASETRIYYGREIYRNNGKSCRYSYASKKTKGNTGTDPRDYITRNRDGTLLDISRLLHKEVVRRLHVEFNKHDIEIYPFNHCVMLIYYGKEFGFSKMGSTLGYHTDMKWGKDGKFLTGINSQRMGSLTVVQEKYFFVRD